MNFQTIQFESASGMLNQLPAGDVPEIVFSGKSNVGKSSLINKLANRKNLARVSSAPGKTATINFYHGAGFRLVDLPGYGFARVSKEEKKRWADLVEGYLAADRPVKLIVQILDFRHMPTADDVDMLTFLVNSGLPFIVVCTKADKLNKTETAKQMAAYTTFLEEEKIPFLPVSSQNGQGIEQLKAILEEACG